MISRRTSHDGHGIAFRDADLAVSLHDARRGGVLADVDDLHLAQAAGRVVALERDPALARFLQEDLFPEAREVEVLCQDVLKFNFLGLSREIGGPLAVVGNLPYQTGETELQELFAQFGSVESVRVMRDMATGRARGFAFVEMATAEEAQSAAASLNGQQLGGRALAVNEARPKPAFAGSGFGGGRDSGRRSEPRW